jgi:hypothetical protein
MTIIPVEHADQVLRLALELENPEEFLMRKGIGDLAGSTPLNPVELVREEAGTESIKH